MGGRAHGRGMGICEVVGDGQPSYPLLRPVQASIGTLNRVRMRGDSLLAVSEVRMDKLTWTKKAERVANIVDQIYGVIHYISLLIIRLHKLTSSI